MATLSYLHKQEGVIVSWKQEVLAAFQALGS